MKYYENIEDFVKYLQKKKKKKLYKWISELLLLGYTSPYIGGSPYKNRSSVIEDLYITGNDLIWREALREAIRDVFKKTLFSTDEAFIELLKTITLLNITELLPELYKYADTGKYKGVKSINIPEFIDKHTIILKSLFGLSIEKDELDNIIKIAKRDIKDKSYMLECFDFLSSNYKNSSQCVTYIPLLLGEMQYRKRNYKGVIIKYLNKFDSDLYETLNLVVEEIRKLKSYKCLLNLKEILSDMGVLEQDYNSIQKAPLLNVEDFEKLMEDINGSLTEFKIHATINDPNIYQTIIDDLEEIKHEYPNFEVAA